jgi:hypothetical protein
MNVTGRGMKEHPQEGGVKEITSGLVSIFNQADKSGTWADTLSIFQNCARTASECLSSAVSFTCI